MEAVQTPETLVNLYQSAQRYSPEDSHLQRSMDFRVFWVIYFLTTHNDTHKYTLQIQHIDRGSLQKVGQYLCQESYTSSLCLAATHNRILHFSEPLGNFFISHWHTWNVLFLEVLLVQEVSPLLHSQSLQLSHWWPEQQHNMSHCINKAQLSVYWYN
jgi:hypothetical protein